MNFSNKFQTAFAKVQILNQALTQNTLEYKIPPMAWKGTWDAQPHQEMLRTWTTLELTEIP